VRSIGRAVMLAVAGLVLAGCSGIVTLTPPEVSAIPVVPPEQSYVYDADGNELAVLRREYRESVAYEELPGHFLDAVVAAEDRRFWFHAGVDARAVARAAAVNYAAGEHLQGGSTITQQLVKNVYFPDAPRDFPTKLREAIVAREVERERSKEEILEQYVNTVYFGAGAYGVKAAAYTYWRKDVSDLTLDESALLAGLIRAPESANPERDPEVARARRDQVLDAMVEEGMIEEDRALAAKRRPVRAEGRPRIPAVREPYWVDFVIRTLLEDRAFGQVEADRASRLYGGGLRIHTTLRPDVQRAAEAAAHRFLTAPAHPEVAVAVVDPASGRILATVGGRDYEQSQFDLATQGRRQPGSAFKTFVLTAAIASGYRPDSRVDGNQGVLRFGQGETYRVRNYGRTNPGTITLEEATRASVNGAYARLILDVGVDRTIAAARALGIEDAEWVMRHLGR
jgi:membrane peptidoglycan carboxypeptidase